MGAHTLEGNHDDGHTPREIEEGIDKLHDFATWGHELGELVLSDVSRGMVTEDTVYRRSRATLPTGYIAVSRTMPRFEGIPPTHPGSENHIG